MGLLDDAIRDHLELMRRRGGDPAELAHQEREALAPAVATTEPAREVRVVDHESEAAAPFTPAPEPAQEEPLEIKPTPVADSPPAPAIEVKEQREIAVEQIKPEEPEPIEPVAEPASNETTTSSADVLDQTPEFLEETPEHDQLWFEQQPPKDFDFQ